MNRAPTNGSTSILQGATTEQEQGDNARAISTPDKTTDDAKHGKQEEPENRNKVTAESVMKDMQKKGGQTGVEEENTHEGIKTDREEATIETNAPPAKGHPIQRWRPT
jgi:hypothetical protein